MRRSWKERWRALRRGLNRQVVWDLFMVYLAMINLGLILFDLTYLWLRPFYDRQLPVATRIYDPVKGIEPEPVTQEYLQRVEELGGQLEAGASSPVIDHTLMRLHELSAEIIDDNPFERSGLEKNRIRMFFVMGEQLDNEGIRGLRTLSPLELAELYWSRRPEPGRLESRVEHFETEAAPLLQANYFRRYSPNGKLTDHFWWIDLPFLTIFIIEFFTRWYLAMKRRTYPRWFFFPIFNWYDLLGIVPIKEMRLFRLFRIASIYVRLSRSEHTIVGDDPVSRTVKYFANIITEEISDMVALRILNETQDEMRKGAHKRIILSAVDSHRDALAAQLALQVSELLNQPDVRRHAQTFLDANLERAVDSAVVLKRLPVPDFLLQPLVEIVGRSIFDAFAETLTATLGSEQGQRAVTEMITDAIDELVRAITEGELERVVREITIEVIDDMKQTVAVRKWALPDQPRRSIFTRDLVE